MYRTTLCEGVWASMASVCVAPSRYTSTPAYHTGSELSDEGWDEPLRTAWARALAVLRALGSELDAVDFQAAEGSVSAASRTLETIGTLRMLIPPSATLNIPRLAAETVDALRWLTDDWINQQDPVGLLTWVLSQGSQLRARLDSWWHYLDLMDHGPTIRDYHVATTTFDSGSTEIVAA